MKWWLPLIVLVLSACSSLATAPTDERENEDTPPTTEEQEAAEEVDKEDPPTNTETPVPNTEEEDDESKNENTSDNTRDPFSPQLEKEAFNQVKEVNGVPTIQNPQNVYTLVNKEMALPSDYKPSDLVRPNVRFVFGSEDVEKAYLRQDAANALEALFQAAIDADITLFATSGYRSYATQDYLFQAEIDQVGYEEAVRAVAEPGTSEHQTGLSMDITAASVNYSLTESFEDTPEGTWLRENAHLFGFILRYPKEMESVTGYKYEPWHFRYVGKEIAKEIFKRGITYEEFIEEAESV